MKKVLAKVRDSFPPFILAHRLYCKWCRKRYKGPQNISILASNCIAGEILYDLGLKYNTPTINLWMK